MRCALGHTDGSVIRGRDTLQARVHGDTNAKRLAEGTLVTGGAGNCASTRPSPLVPVPVAHELHTLYQLDEPRVV